MKIQRSLLATLLMTASLQAAPTSNPLNICFFLADDVRVDCIGVLGSQIVKTPHIDKLGKVSGERCQSYLLTFLIGRRTVGKGVSPIY